MSYAKLNTNNEVEVYPYYPKDLFEDYPNYKTPWFNKKSPRPDNVVLVMGETPSSYDPATQKISYSTTPTLIDGEWKLAVTVTDKTAEELSSQSAAATEVEANEIRSQRNKLLTETDWWAVQDRTMSSEETQYRQALRDITEQDGFPTNITWPTKPE